MIKTIIKTTILGLLLSFTATNAKAQLSVSISSDVSSIYFGGYALEGGINFNKTRYSASFSQFEIPSFINYNFDSIKKVRKSLDVKISRFLGTEQRGLHYGINTGLVLGESSTLIDSAGAKIPGIPNLEQTYVKVGISVGYFWHPFKNHKTWKGLFIEPNIGVIYKVNKDDILLGTAAFESKPFELDLPRLNIGYKLQF